MVSKPTTRDLSKIPLRNRAGEVIAHALVDPEDYERVMAEGRWSLAKRGYVYRRKQVQGRQFEVKLHRFILGARPEDPIIDHRDRDKLNNSKINLRFCTYAQNTTNRAGKPGTSKYRGVRRQSDGSGWCAIHTLNGKSVYIGFYRNEENAAQAAKDWRKIHMPFSEEPDDDA